MKTLLISPHVDDEVLGCGGILDSDTFVYFCGIDESSLAPDPAHRIPKLERAQELADVAAFYGFAYEINEKTRVNHYTIQELIGPIEAAINRIKPETILIPHPGYNQDHQTAFRACQVALRPHDKNFFVKRVLVYEAIHDFIWSHEKFTPTYFVPIDIERKIQGYARHKSQVRGMRSMDMLRTFARARGMMCNSEYAEAFEVQRWVA